MSKQFLKEMLVMKQAEKKTGKLVVIGKAGKNSRIGNFILSNGELMNARYLNLSGNDAVNAILDLEISQVSFLAYPESPEPPCPDISSISSILETLSGSGVAHANNQSISKNTISRDEQTVLITILSQFIGPIAGAVSQRILSENTDIDTAISAIASEIPDVDQAAKFIKESKRHFFQAGR